LEARELKKVVKRAARGDESAAAQLFDTYYPRVVRYALARLGRHAAAEDVAAETFARVLRGLDRFRWRDGGFEAWLFRMASNLVVDHARLSGRERAEEDVLNRADGVDTRTPEEATLRFETAGDLGQLLHRLVPDQRQVLLLRFVAELGPEEIGRVMDRKSNAVRQLQFRALANLRTMMEERAEAE
jgi:RNA polymerase sigma-70 factor (ECF subfamily)